MLVPLASPTSLLRNGWGLSASIGIDLASFSEDPPGICSDENGAGRVWKAAEHVDVVFCFTPLVSKSCAPASSHKSGGYWDVGTAAGVMSSTSNGKVCPVSPNKWLKFFSILAYLVLNCGTCHFFFVVLNVGTVSIIWLSFRLSWLSSIAKQAFLWFPGLIIEGSQAEAALLFAALLNYSFSAWKANDGNHLPSYLYNPQNSWTWAASQCIQTASFSAGYNLKYLHFVSYTSEPSKHSSLRCRLNYRVFVTPFWNNTKISIISWDNSRLLLSDAPSRSFPPNWYIWIANSVHIHSFTNLPLTAQVPFPPVLQ